MSEEREKLQATLNKLHDELAGIEHVDDDARKLLESAIAEIRTVLELDQRDETASEASTIVSQLKQSARHYEDTHPTLSGIIGSMIDALSRMGI